jgi:hypothetical protein
MLEAHLPPKTVKHPRGARHVVPPGPNLTLHGARTGLPPVWFLGVRQAIPGDPDPAMQALGHTARAAEARPHGPNRPPWPPGSISNSCAPGPTGTPGSSGRLAFRAPAAGHRHEWQRGTHRCARHIAYRVCGKTRLGPDSAGRWRRARPSPT